MADEVIMRWLPRAATLEALAAICYGLAGDNVFTVIFALMSGLTLAGWLLWKDRIEAERRRKRS